MAKGCRGGRKGGVVREVNQHRHQVCGARGFQVTGVVVVVMVGGRVHPERGGWWIDGCVGGRECWRPRAVRVGVDDFIQSSLGIIGRANPKLFNWRPNRDDPREQWMIGLVIGFCGFFNLFLSGLVYIYIYISPNSNLLS